jgi:hypothetical protein
MYEAIMRLGVKGIYFREDKNPKVSFEFKGKSMNEPKISRNFEVKHHKRYLSVAKVELKNEFTDIETAQKEK